MDVEIDAKQKIRFKTKIKSFLEMGEKKCSASVDLSLCVTREEIVKDDEDAQQQ